MSVSKTEIVVASVVWGVLAFITGFIFPPAFVIALIAWLIAFVIGVLNWHEGEA